MFRLLLFIIPIGALGNIIFAFISTDRDILLSVQHFHFRFLALAMLLALVPWITHLLRLIIWTRFLGQRFSLRELFLIVLGTELGSAVTPTAIGGGYIKLGMLVQKGFSPGKSTFLMTLGSLEDGLFFLFALPVAATLSSSWNLPVIRSSINSLSAPVKTAAVVLLAIVCVISLLLWIISRSKEKLGTASNRPIWNRTLTGFTKFWHDFTQVYILVAKRGKSRFALSIILTAIQWISRYTVISALLMCLGISCDPMRLFLLQWIVFTIMTFIPTPGASFGAEASFYLIYSSILPKESIGLVTSAWRFLTFYLQISLGSALFLALNRPPASERQEIEMSGLPAPTSAT